MKGLIAIIPARGGSKGIPGKNIKLLNGKPLIAYTIEAALQSKEFDRVIVSTDDAEIAKVAQKYGAEVFDRPEQFARDDSTMEVVIKDVLCKMEKKPFAFALLQPTSPLRDKIDIIFAVGLFRDLKYMNLVSVSEPRDNPYLAVQQKDGNIEPLLGWEWHLNRCRQEFPETFVVNGAIYLTTVDNFLEYDNLFGEKAFPYEIDKKKGIDIDDELDFKFVEVLMHEKN